MKKLGILIFSICYLVPGYCQYLESQVQLGASPYELNRAEIRDSGYKSVLIHRMYSDHIGNDNWRDTIYFATFDTAGRTILEKHKRMDFDSITNIFHYDKQGRVSKVVSYKTRWAFPPQKTSTIIIEDQYAGNLLSRKIYTIINPVQDSNRIVKQFLYNKNNQLIKETFGETEITYQYRNDGKYTVVTHRPDKTTQYRSVYEYKREGTDSIVLISTIEQQKTKTDTAFQELRFNKLGKKIYESRWVSKTYYKTFTVECSVGDRYTNTWSYDDVGRLTEDERNIYLYGANFFYKPGETTNRRNVIFVTEGEAYNKRWEMKINNSTVTLDSYLSEKSKLLEFKDRMDGYAGNEKIFFEYAK